MRFKNKKAKYIVRARELFQEIRKALKRYKGDELRLWLIRNICGLDYKEASHFLRNIGLGEQLAILDRHILRNLKALGIIKKIPRVLTGGEYIKI
ncbi:MAG: hypothetical protein QMD71_08435 [bacterium]|nr:hypothetical protein [bacterium]